MSFSFQHRKYITKICEMSPKSPAARFGFSPKKERPKAVFLQKKFSNVENSSKMSFFKYRGNVLYEIREDTKKKMKTKVSK